MKVDRFLAVSWRSLVFFAAFSAVSVAGDKRVTTVVGGFLGDGGAATSASFAYPVGVVRDSRGDLYVSDSQNCRIRRINAQGIIVTFAGTGICGYSGDDGPAKSARLQFPYGIAFDRKGNLLIAGGPTVRSISPAGIITTVAGTGRPGYTGDGGPATKATLNGVLGIALDPSGDLYIVDSNNDVIREVDAAGVIHTVAGNHTAGFSGDGGPAATASLHRPVSVLADAAGNFYISDNFNFRVRKVDLAGTITTYAGDGTAGSFGSYGDGGPATSAHLGATAGLHVAAGKLYIGSGSSSGLIWAVDLKTQLINIIAGTGVGSFNGDGHPALSTTFLYPTGILSDGSGGLFVTDAENNRVRHIDSTQIVTTVAGGGLNDGQRAIEASIDLGFPFCQIAFDPKGNLYIAEVLNHRIRKVSRTGIITTLAGNGISGYSGDGGPASAAILNSPEAVAADGNGNIYIADTGNNVIRKIDSSGTITTFLRSFSTFNFGARAVALAVDASGNLYASDGIFVIWKITPSGNATIVAGIMNEVGYNGDGIPATQATLLIPTGVAVDGMGNLYIADTINNRIRKVDTAGIISTVAGNGLPAFSGDGAAATSAALNEPYDVAVDTAGNIYIADAINFRIRVVDTSGTINTLAGTGDYGYNGNNVLASRAHMFPEGLAIRNNVLYFSDGGSYRVRKIN
jgi:sugar lactone lactonase YvrE